MELRAEMSNSYNNNNYINLKDEIFGKLGDLFKSDRKISLEKVFSRMCALHPNSYGGNIEAFTNHYRELYGEKPRFKLQRYEQHDSNSYYYSGKISFKLLQTGFKSGQYFDNCLKSNTYCLCPFCNLKHKTKHKKHPIQIRNEEGKMEEVDSNVEGFYDTGKSELCHHLAECHGVLKKSLMPQPFLGFSRSLGDKNVYELALICPHQHWDEKIGQFVGCNSIFSYNIGKTYDADIPFKSYFRHFYKCHVSEPKDESSMSRAEARIQRETIRKKIDEIAKQKKHIQTVDNVFIPLNALAYQETLNYQMKNRRENGQWNPTLEVIGFNEMNYVTAHCLDDQSNYHPPCPKDDPIITHGAAFRTKDSPPVSSGSNASTSNNSENVRRPLKAKTNRSKIEKPAFKAKNQYVTATDEQVEQLNYDYLLQMNPLSDAQLAALFNDPIDSSSNNNNNLDFSESSYYPNIDQPNQTQVGTDSAIMLQQTHQGQQEQLAEPQVNFGEILDPQFQNTITNKETNEAPVMNLGPEDNGGYNITNTLEDPLGIELPNVENGNCDLDVDMFSVLDFDDDQLPDDSNYGIVGTVDYANTGTPDDLNFNGQSSFFQ